MSTPVATPTTLTHGLAIGAIAVGSVALGLIVLMALVGLYNYWHDPSSSRKKGYKREGGNDAADDTEALYTADASSVPMKNMSSSALQSVMLA